MAKRNWSKSEPSVRKPHAANFAKKMERYEPTNHGEVITNIDWLLVQAAFASKSDPNRAQQYQPPIVGKSICR